ncbi:MAG: hypothetical protein OEZ06_14880 [Myxococcales bacterium]|nr:hypothetical protein [Myxococcales bacterium]
MAHDGPAMEQIKEKNIGGVVQRDFRIEVEGEQVPVVLWTRRDGPPAPVLICMGHGGSQHKKTEGIRARGVEYARDLGWATLAIDAPGHGDRISREDAAQLAREVGARVQGQQSPGAMDGARLRSMFAGAGKATREWKASLDAVLALDEVASDAAIGYWGVSMGTALGVPFVAAEPRIRCAIFGLAGLRPGATEFAEAAKRIEIPVQFVFQWEDAVAPREAGIELFNAFGAKEKTMHINPGGHLAIPRFERDAWRAFFERHLTAR